MGQVQRLQVPLALGISGPNTGLSKQHRSKGEEMHKPAFSIMPGVAHGPRLSGRGLAGVCCVLNTPDQSPS